MRHANEITMTWDAAAIAASLPKDSAFTFMDLLAMKGHAPVVVESRPHVIVAVENGLSALGRAGRRALASVASFIEWLDEPAFNFMSLLTENGHVPAWVQTAAEEQSTLGRLMHGWANENWKAPANNNEVQKVA